MHAPSQIRLTFNQDHPEPHEHEDEGAGLAVQESKPVLQPPPLYKVVLFNDDYTPMDFVVEVLEVFFNMDREKATKIMLTVHTQGKAVCGLFTRTWPKPRRCRSISMHGRASIHCSAR